MKKEAILHVPLSQYAYALGEHHLVVRLRTAKGDCRECVLFYGDRADPNPEICMTRVEMKRISSDDLFDYYEAQLVDTCSRVCYYFGITDEEETVFYCERGLVSEISCGRTEYFQFPYIRREDLIDIPDWAQDAVMYQIFPDSFATRRRSLEKKKKVCVKMQHGRETTSVSLMGGSICGITENVDYLAQLGINCVYLNPIFMANSYHKYDTADYLTIDPCFGTMQDMKAFVKKAHENGIRVILDGVFNHCGPDFFAFVDVLDKGSASEYYDWFYHMPEPVSYADPPNYAAFAYVKEMPKLNTANPDLEKYLIDVGLYWIRETNIDGWRLDVANEINHDFWRHFREGIRREKPDAFLIGEIWEDAGVWLQGDQFDSTMNYRFTYLCMDFFAKRRLTVSEFDAQIQKMIMRYPSQVSHVQMNFLDTHDVPRFLTYCGEKRERMRLAFFYLFVAYGIPSVLYGDEMYLSGMTEPEYRSPMPWGQEENAFAFFQKGIAIRKKHSAIRNGGYRTILCEDRMGLYAFERYNAEESVLVLMNNSDQSIEVKGELRERIERKVGKGRCSSVTSIAEMQGIII